MAQTLQVLTLLAPPSSAILYSSSNLAPVISPHGHPDPGGTAPGRRAGAGKPQLREVGSTSLPAGHDHAVIGALAMNSAEKGESASENSQLSSHFPTEELTTFVR